MVTVNIWGFPGVVRLLMEFFDTRHLFGFFADLDTVSGQKQATVNFNQRATGQHDLPPVMHDGFQLPGRCPEK